MDCSRGRKDSCIFPAVDVHNSLYIIIMSVSTSPSYTQGMVIVIVCL